jgi:uncharacterized HAD superfamily protein
VLIEAPHIKFMVDDHRYFANLAAQWGYKVFLMDNEYNQGGMIPGVTRVFNFSDILSNLEEVKRWPQ